MLVEMSVFHRERNRRYAKGIGLDSYDNLFPNPDTLPRGNFGTRSRSRCRKHRANEATAFSSTTNLSPTPTSGRYCPRLGESIARL
jgi:hypothetical protein